MDDQATIIDAFSEMAPRYEQVIDTEMNRFWGWDYAGFINLMVAFTPVQPQDIILDVATGTGLIPSLLQKAAHPASQVHGLDITRSMLTHARHRLGGQDGRVDQNLVCASAMDMPYADSDFMQVFCGLATHHMDVKKLLGECHRVLRSGGKLTIADAGGSPAWKIPGVKFLLRLAAFGYFSLVENKTRAWAEARAVSNVLSKEEWTQVLLQSGFREIVIRELRSRYSWVPSPLLIKAEKF
jgi:ubiquinone/menaquinone biosynthesis C-methylase UbiE